MTNEEVIKNVGGKVVDEWEQGEEIKAGWIKLKENESVKGTLVGKHFSKSNKPGFKDQWVYEILVGQGVMNIGFSVDKTFINGKLKNVVIGQIVMIKRKEDVPSKMFPGKTANSYDARLFGIDPDYKSNEEEESGELDANDIN
jgi:hypothetical protein